MSTNQRKPTCYVCGSTDIAIDADLRSPTCERCKPAREHVVSMQTGPGGSSLAICPCGWSSEVPWKGHHAVQDAGVRQHWLSVSAAPDPGTQTLTDQPPHHESTRA